MIDAGTEEADARTKGYRCIGEFPHRGAGTNFAATGLKDEIVDVEPTVRARQTLERADPTNFFAFLCPLFLFRRAVPNESCTPEITARAEAAAATATTAAPAAAAAAATPAADTGSRGTSETAASLDSKSPLAN